MGKVIDLIGERFGRLVVIERLENHVTPNGTIKSKWLCLCDCGNEKIVVGGDLRNGHTTSCGCYNVDKLSERLLDLTGKRFGRFIVIRRVHDYIMPSGKHSPQWLCKCDCGNEKLVHGNSLRSHHTVSCGCQTESYVASELKQYCVETYSAVPEYRELKNPSTGFYLPYDIFIPDNIFIEVHGKQHYTTGSWNTTEEDFEYRKYLDQLKREYAEQNGTYIEIDLRTIKTTDDAIEYIESYLR